MNYFCKAEIFSPNATPGNNFIFHNKVLHHSTLHDHAAFSLISISRNIQSFLGIQTRNLLCERLGSKDHMRERKAASAESVRVTEGEGREQQVQSSDVLLLHLLSLTCFRDLPVSTTLPRG